MTFGPFFSPFFGPFFNAIESPPSLEGGAVSYVNGSTHLGSQARYACHRSHSLAEGDKERECLASGEWSGAQPACSEIRCSLPPRPNNTIISVSR